MWQRSDGVVAIYEEGRSPAGLYIHLFGPKEDVVSAEPGIRSGRSACLNQLIITSGYIYGPKKRQSLNLHFHKSGFLVQLRSRKTRYYRSCHKQRGWLLCSSSSGGFTAAADVSMARAVHQQYRLLRQVRGACKGWCLR